MTFKKLFNIGYAVFLIACLLVYFLIPHTYGWVVLVTLAVLFGIYQVFILWKMKQKRSTS
ncbi:hypothetical protein BK139_22005 [Paenibacillus sp. FSL R5-0490]|uniref:hypothetical protein n=1 Tax=Bacillales TaxID=1385 RepID=UPI00096D18BA|nr:hypothetical protein [Paenibacillus sp. FSL R5-0490]OMF52823.1 hypothetical protein BK139_22005 [Paenibacillus sp. FSL R5-0490]